MKQSSCEWYAPTKIQSITVPNNYNYMKFLFNPVPRPSSPGLPLMYLKHWSGGGHVTRLGPPSAFKMKFCCYGSGYQ